MGRVDVTLGSRRHLSNCTGGPRQESAGTPLTMSRRRSKFFGGKAFIGVIQERDLIGVEEKKDVVTTAD